MERLIILVGRLYKSVAPTKYFFKVPIVGRFMPLVGVIRRPVESPLHRVPVSSSHLCSTVHFGYSGHLGPALSGHYIRPEYNRINVLCTRKSGHYIRMATLNVATISEVHCIDNFPNTVICLHNITIYTIMYVAGRPGPWPWSDSSGKKIDV